MTNVMKSESKLKLPTCYVEITDNEMEYLDGGAWSWSVCGNWIGTAAISGAIAGGAAGFFFGASGIVAGIGIGFVCGAVIGFVGYSLFGWW